MTLPNTPAGHKNSGSLPEAIYYSGQSADDVLAFQQSAQFSQFQHEYTRHVHALGDVVRTYLPAENTSDFFERFPGRVFSAGSSQINATAASQFYVLKKYLERALHAIQTAETLLNQGDTTEAGRQKKQSFDFKITILNNLGEALRNSCAAGLLTYTFNATLMVEADNLGTLWSIVKTNAQAMPDVVISRQMAKYYPGNDVHVAWSYRKLLGLPVPGEDQFLRLIPAYRIEEARTALGDALAVSNVLSWLALEEYLEALPAFSLKDEVAQLNAADNQGARARDELTIQRSQQIHEVIENLHQQLRYKMLPDDTEVFSGSIDIRQLYEIDDNDVIRGLHPHARTRLDVACIQLIREKLQALHRQDDPAFPDWQQVKVAEDEEGIVWRVGNFYWREQEAEDARIVSSLRPSDLLMATENTRGIIVEHIGPQQRQRIIKQAIRQEDAILLQQLPPQYLLHERDMAGTCFQKLESMGKSDVYVRQHLSWFESRAFDDVPDASLQTTLQSLPPHLILKNEETALSLTARGFNTAAYLKYYFSQHPGYLNVYLEASAELLTRSLRHFIEPHLVDYFKEEKGRFIWYLGALSNQFLDENGRTVNDSRVHDLVSQLSYENWLILLATVPPHLLFPEAKKFTSTHYATSYNLAAGLNMISPALLQKYFTDWLASHPDYLNTALRFPEFVMLNWHAQNAFAASATEYYRHYPEQVTTAALTLSSSRVYLELAKCPEFTEILKAFLLETSADFIMPEFIAELLHHLPDSTLNEDNALMTILGEALKKKNFFQQSSLKHDSDYIALEDIVYIYTRLIQSGDFLPDINRAVFFAKHIQCHPEYSHKGLAALPPEALTLTQATEFFSALEMTGVGRAVSYARQHKKWFSQLLPVTGNPIMPWSFSGLLPRAGLQEDRVARMEAEDFFALFDSGGHLNLWKGVPREIKFAAAPANLIKTQGPSYIFIQDMLKAFWDADGMARIEVAERLYIAVSRYLEAHHHDIALLSRAVPMQALRDALAQGIRHLADDKAIRKIKARLQLSSRSTQAHLGSDTTTRNREVQNWLLPDVRAPLMAEGTADYEKQLIIQLEDNTVVREAAQALAEKHRTTSLLVQMDAAGDYRVVILRDNAWVPSTPAEKKQALQQFFSATTGRVRFQLVGQGSNRQGDISDDRNNSLGGQESGTLAIHLKTLSEEAGCTPDHIVLVGCAMTDSEAPQSSFAGQLMHNLSQKGLQIRTLSAYTELLHVTSTGRKRDLMGKSRIEKIRFSWQNSQLKAEKIFREKRTGISEKITALNQLLDRISQGKVLPGVPDASERALLAECYGRDWQNSLREIALHSAQGRKLIATAAGLSAKEADNLQTALHRAGREYALQERQYHAVRRILLHTSPELARLDEALLYRAIEKIIRLDKIRHVMNIGEDISVQGGSDNVSRAVNAGGKTVFGIGTVAALFRLIEINKTLAAGGLTGTEENQLRHQKTVALTELCMDASDEVGDIVSLSGPRFAETVHRLRVKFQGLKIPAALPAGASFNHLLTTSLRAAGNLAGPLLAGAGAYFAWRAVEETLEELNKEGVTENKKNELAKVLALNITGAALSTGLPITACIGLISGMACALGATSALLSSAAVAAGTASLVTGVALMAVFVAQWVITGESRVREVEKYTLLTHQEKLQVGLGALFGMMPAEVKIRYQFAEMMQRVHEDQAVHLESIGFKAALTDYYGTAGTMEITPGKRKPRFKQIIHLPPRASGGALLLPDYTTPPQSRPTFGRIDLPAQIYESFHADGSRWSEKEKEQRMHHGYQGRYRIMEKALLPGTGTYPIACMTYNHSRGRFTSVTTTTWLDAERQTFYRKDTPLPGVTLQGYLNGNGRKDTLSVFADGRAQVMLNGLEGSSTHLLPTSLFTDLFTGGNLPYEAEVRILLHDIDDDGLSDLVAIHSNARLRVALNQGNGYFGPVTSDFIIYGATTEQDDVFQGLEVIGFQPGTHTLLSYRAVESGKIEPCASFVVPVGHSSSHKRSWVDFGKKNFAGKDVFVASQDEQGKYFFQVYNSQSQEFTGGPGEDEFHFRLSAARFSDVFEGTLAAEWPVDIVLKGAGGNDSIVFLAEENTAHGVTAHLSTDLHSLPSFFFTQGSAGRLQLMDIENVTGTPYGDRLSSAMPWGAILNGNGGADILTGGDGDDTLMTEHGWAAGSKGKDTYVILESQVNGQLYIQESTMGEYSSILLPYTLSQIQAIYQDSTALCLDLDNGNGTTRALRLEGFYSPLSEEALTSRYDIHSRDGFSFQLTAGTAIRETRPASQKSSDTSDNEQDPAGEFIQVRYRMENDRTLRAQEVKDAVLYQKDEQYSAMISVQNIQDSALEPRRLPAFFQLALYGLPDRRSELYGAGEAEILVAQAGSASLMRGNGGADHYVVVDSDKPGPLYIDNRNTAVHPAQDTLILPWQFDDITWSVLPGGLKGVHESRQDPAHPVRQEFYLTLMDETPHLCVHDRNADIRYFFGQRDNHLITLSDGPLSMDERDRLELNWSSGSVELDGRTRRVDGVDARPTVILDKSGAGNHIYGTAQISNVIQAVAGNNVLQGGDMNDHFYSGTGADTIDGQGGRDRLYFSAGNGHDTLSEVEVVEFSTALTRDSLRITEGADTPDHQKTVRLNFEGATRDSLTFTGYSEEALKQVELHFTCDKGAVDIVPLVELMVTLPGHAGCVTGTTEGVFFSNRAGYAAEIVSWPLTARS